MIIGGFIVALLTAALVAPLFINWTDYRAEFEAQASAILGRPVKVAGEASARLIPFPSVTFHDVRVGDDPDNPMLTAERFSMDAELAPFLSGEVLIFDMRVVKPTGLITLDPDGVVDWTVRPSAPINPSQIRIENLVVEDGNLTLDDLGASRRHEMTGVNATISARALTGPWRVNGSAAFDGEPMAVSVTSGSVSDKGELPLAMTITPAKRGFVVEGDGTAKSTDGRLSWAGGFTVRQSRLTDQTGPVLKDGSGTLTGDEPKPSGWQAKGRFALDGSKLDVPEIRLETGTRDNPYISNGKGLVLFGAQPMFDLALEGSQVTFSDADEAAPKAGDRLASIRETLNAIPMPDMNGTVTFNLPAIVAGDTTIRDIGFSASPEAGAWRVRDFRATLPGRTRMEADGVFGTGDRFGFEGRMTVASSQPAGFSNWLTGTADATIRNLKALGFSADVVLRTDSQIFRNLELAIDASIFKGEAERRTDGIRPSIQAKLTGGELPLSALTALGSGLLAPEGGSRFGGHDVALSLDAGPVTDGDITAATLGVTARLKEDRLDIDRLMIGDLAGSTISAIGSAENLRAAVKFDVDASLVSADAAPLLEVLAGKLTPESTMVAVLRRVGSVPDFLKDIRANLILSSQSEGGIRAMTASYTARTASGEQTLTGTLSGEGFTFSPGDVSGNLVIREDNPLKLLELAGLPVLPMDLGGPAELTLKAEGRLADELSVTANYNAEGISADWKGGITGAVGALVSSGAFKLKAQDLDPYLQATGMVIAGTGTGTPVELETQTKTAEGVVSFDGFDLKIADAALSGDAKFDSKPERGKITGTVKVQSIDGLMLAESLYGPATLAGLDAAFPASALIPFDADITLSSPVFSFPPLGAGSDLTAAFTADANGIRLSGIKAKMAGGALAGNLEARNDGGTGALSGDFSLRAANIDSLVGRAGVGGKTDISGSVSGTGKSMDGMIAALSGSGTVTATGSTIPGLNPEGFSAIAVLASSIEKAPLDGEVKALIDGPVRSSAFPLPTEPIAWNLSGGKLKIPSIRSETSGAALEASLVADPLAWTAEFGGTMIYKAGKFAVAGAEPQVPFRILISSDQTEVETDPQPLTQYLTQAALEREQARVEAMQASLIEKQRLRREARRIALLYSEREKRSQARESAVRRAKAEQAAVMLAAWKAEQERIAAEEKARQEAEAAARKAAEEEAARKAAEEAAKVTDPGLAPPQETAPQPQPTDPQDAETLKWLKLKLN